MKAAAHRSLLCSVGASVLSAFVIGLAGEPPTAQVPSSPEPPAHSAPRLNQAPGGEIAAPPSDAVPLRISIAGAAFRGRADASIVVVEFSDFDCPFCRRHALTTFPLIDAGYIQPGKVKYVFRHFPLRIHPGAIRAHEAAACAAEQGRFWEMHDALFRNPARTSETLVTLAERAHLSVEQFVRCVEGEGAAARIGQDIAEGRAAGIRGTPAFFVGRAGPDTNVTVAAAIRGAKPFGRFQGIIDQLLREQAGS